MSGCEKHLQNEFENALVADIDADGIIYKSIMEYVQLLNEKSADITLPLASVCSCKATARVKRKTRLSLKFKTTRQSDMNLVKFNQQMYQRFIRHQDLFCESHCL